MERAASKSELVLSRPLRPFAQVEPSEAVTAVVLTATVFLLLCGYYLLKTAREPLILLGGVVVVALGREHRRREGYDLSAVKQKDPILRRALGVAGVSGVALAATRADAAPAKRHLPDYDGCGGEPTTPGDVAVWVPRGALAPAYLVYDFGIRRPLGAL